MKQRGRAYTTTYARDAPRSQTSKEQLKFESELADPLARSLALCALIVVIMCSLLAYLYGVP